jgi:hypothetical protein
LYSFCDHNSSIASDSSASESIDDNIVGANIDAAFGALVLLLLLDGDAGVDDELLDVVDDDDLSVFSAFVGLVGFIFSFLPLSLDDVVLPVLLESEVVLVDVEGLVDDVVPLVEVVVDVVETDAVLADDDDLLILLFFLSALDCFLELTSG